jgi:3-dehydroquinate dehydratase-2
MKTALVLNGPNLNLLGTREPAVYGSQTLADVEALCVDACKAHGFKLDFRQSNHEGALIDAIHEAGRAQAAGVTLIELHISNVHAREAFRHHSYISPAAKAVMAGFGVKGYALAIAGLAGLAG